MWPFDPAAKQTSKPIYWTVIVAVVVSQKLVNANFSSTGAYRQKPSCVPIPSDLKLCRDVAYPKMVLPNLLRHESLDEVRQQASSFVPLLTHGCHRYLQEFLCSLFAPVCLKQPESAAIMGPIPPCRSFCKSVERSCLPIMRRHSFDWPPMLNCSQFTEQDPCVNLVDDGSDDDGPGDDGPPPSPPTNYCAPCDTDLTLDALHDNYCANEFVLKIKAKKVKTKKSKGIREIVADRKRRKIYKSGPLSNRDLRRLKLVVRGSKRCVCQPVDNKPAGSSQKKQKGKKSKAFYLVMGRKVGRKLLVTVIHSWPKKNKTLKKASKNNFGARQCPEFGIDLS